MGGASRSAFENSDKAFDISGPCVASERPEIARRTLRLRHSPFIFRLQGRGIAQGGALVGKDALGEKQTCPSCGAKFYDLSKRPAICPKCRTAFDPADETVRLRRTRTRAAAYDSQFEDEEEVRAEAEDEAEEEVEEAPEIDQEAVEEPPVLSDEEDEAAPAEGEIPPGFTEEDGEIGEEAGDEDEGVPLLEDEEEFPDEELADLGEGDEGDERER
jgi:uncharacterized protein (TIGR02300 family)